MGPHRTVTILTICGSLGPISANRAALDVVARTALAAGATVTTDEVLADVPPFRPELVDTPPDAVAAFRRQIAEADVVVIAAPEYAGGVGGTIKNALDWVVGSADLYGKPVGVMAAGTTGGANARAQLTLTLQFQGAIVVADLGIAAPKTKSDDRGRYTHAPTISAIEAFTRSVLTAASVA